MAIRDPRPRCNHIITGATGVRWVCVRALHETEDMHDHHWFVPMDRRAAS